MNQISPLLVYFWGQADNIIYIAERTTLVFSIIGLIGFIITYLVPVSEYANDESKSKTLKFFRRFLYVGGVSCLTWIAAPSSKTVALMYVVPKIANSTVIQKDMPELYNMAVEALKERLKTEKE